MADVFNKNPSEYVDMNEFFPILNDKVGLTYEQWRILVENVNYVKNNSDNIKELVGTLSKPINFAYDMEVGKLYNCKGFVYVDSSSIYELSSNTDSQDGFVLIYKPSLGNVISALDGHVWMFDSYGNILIQSGIKIISVNDRDEGHFSLYTPETSGVRGQILQSNGEDSAPTWLNIGDGLSVENGTLKASGGKLYRHNIKALFNISNVGVQYVTTTIITNSSTTMSKNDFASYLSNNGYTQFNNGLSVNCAGLGNNTNPNMFIIVDKIYGSNNNLGIGYLKIDIDFTTQTITRNINTVTGNTIIDTVTEV